MIFQWNQFSFEFLFRNSHRNYFIDVFFYFATANVRMQCALYRYMHSLLSIKPQTQHTCVLAKISPDKTIVLSEILRNAFNSKKSYQFSLENLFLWLSRNLILVSLLLQCLARIHIFKYWWLACRSSENTLLHCM